MDLYADYKQSNGADAKLGGTTAEEADKDGLSVDAPEFFP